MTDVEWHALEYSKVSSLQKWLADRSLEHLKVEGTERVLDVGCGDGKITAEIARRVPAGSVMGVDESHDMIDFARRTFPPSQVANLDFAVRDARALGFDRQFDLVVSFNALHWVAEQETALRGIRDALAGGGRALLQMVGHGTRRSLEHVIAETCEGPAWSSWFHDFRQPYVHFTPARYQEMAEACGFIVDEIPLITCHWDFGSRDAFTTWAEATFLAWTARLPAELHLRFIHDVLDAYRDDHVFTFYQMRAMLRRR